MFVVAGAASLVRPFMATEDPVEAAMLQATVEAALVKQREIDEARDRNMAIMIANYVGKVIGH